jgi:hypothetical protein
MSSGGGKSLLILLGIGAAAAVASKALAGKSFSTFAPSPPVTFKGETIDPSIDPATIRVGASKLALVEWAKSKGFVAMPDSFEGKADPEFQRVLSGLGASATNTLGRMGVAALFGVMKANPMLAVVAYIEGNAHREVFLALPP